MGYTNYRNGNNTDNYTDEFDTIKHYEDNVQYQLINLNPNESCYVSNEDNTFLKNAYTQITNNSRNNTKRNKQVQIINVKELPIDPDEYNKTMCFTYFSTVSYYILAPAGIHHTISCNLETENGSEVCMCAYTNKELNINQTMSCLCYEQKIRKYSGTPKEFESTYFGRNCTVLAKDERKTNQWLFRCAFHNTMPAFEQVYFNISDTDNEGTISDLIEDGSTVSTEFSKATTSQKSMETSSFRASSDVSNHRTYNVSTFPNSTISNETLKNISKRSIEILSPLTKNTQNRVSYGLHYGKQQKLIGTANSHNYTLNSNPIVLLLFLFVQLFVYYGFLRKEYLQMHKKRR